MKEVQGLFQGIFRGVLMKFPRKFQGGLKRVSKKVSNYFKNVSMKLFFNSDSREFQGYLNSNCVSIKFQKGLKKVMSVFYWNLKNVTKIFEEWFNEICFVILLLHGTHCSYPSRGRACFFLAFKSPVIIFNDLIVTLHQ